MRCLRDDLLVAACTTHRDDEDVNRATSQRLSLRLLPLRGAFLGLTNSQS